VIFIPLKLRHVLWDLETKFILKPDIFTFLKLMRHVISEEAHLRRANFRTRSSLASLGRVVRSFSKWNDSSYGLQCRHGLSFTVSF